jgi:hypothetical protein
VLGATLELELEKCCAVGVESSMVLYYEVISCCTVLYDLPASKNDTSGPPEADPFRVLCKSACHYRSTKGNSHCQ